MKKAELALLTGLILSVIIGNISAFALDCGSVRTEVLRLHILANSDSEKDQSLKLCVRDAILKKSSEIFEPSLSLSQAEKSASEHLDEIKKIAEETLKQNGSTQSVSVCLCDTYFETREYDGVTLPAGEYRALRVLIGRAEGKNWWCVLFPALCIPASQKQDEMNKAFSQSEIDTVSAPKYKAKFAIVEFFQKISSAE